MGKKSGKGKRGKDSNKGDVGSSNRQTKQAAPEATTKSAEVRQGQTSVEDEFRALELSSASSEDDIVNECKARVREDPTISIAVAAIQTLTLVIKRSKATTMMGLEIELKAATDTLKSYGKSTISLTAGCELFSRYVTRTSLELTDFLKCKAKIIERGEWFAQQSLQNRQRIAKLANRFVRDGKVLLLHGFSRVVVQCCLYAAQEGRNFSVVVAESRPDFAGYDTARELSAAGIPVQVVLDAAVGSYMEKVDLVLLGAEAVVENGGIINKVGSYQISIVASALKKPVYVAAESYKFARLFPLSQSDVARENKQANTPFQPLDGSVLPAGVLVDNPSVDYTPPSCITLLFTDLGILTPSAVSDELIKLYY